MNGNVPEILAPAGTYEAFEAALSAGCDAVYAGGSLYSARAYAGNLSEGEFIKALDRAHLFGKKIYLTLNTLLKETEAGDALQRFIMPLYKAGLDAVIVQDMGVFSVIKDSFPDLPVHASTQLGITSAYGASLAKELGFERVVCGRELTLTEIISIRSKADIEIETFVHGAMCYAYSGKCLFSSFAGGRSGNRGRCAQPCRKVYELTADNDLPLKEGVKEHIMSLKDMCTIKELPYLIDAQIDSFKIEGRMKNPSYVALTTQTYKNARDLYIKLKGNKTSFDDLSPGARKEYLRQTEEYMNDLKDIYNRGGFSSGYFFTEGSFAGAESDNVVTDVASRTMLSPLRPSHAGLETGTIKKVCAPDVSIALTRDVNKGDVLELIGVGEKSGVELTCNVSGKAGDVISLKGKELKRLYPGMKVFRTKNAALLRRIKEDILDAEPVIAAECHIEAYKNRPLKIILNSGEVNIEMEGELVEKAENAPVTAEVLAGKMKKSTGSGIEITTVRCYIDEDAFVRMSAFNELRRKAADAVREEIVGRYHR